MYKQTPVKEMEDLQLGDIIMVKKHHKGAFEIKSMGLASFLEFVDSRKISCSILNRDQTNFEG